MTFVTLFSQARSPTHTSVTDSKTMDFLIQPPFETAILTALASPANRSLLLCRLHPLSQIVLSILPWSLALTTKADTVVMQAQVFKVSLSESLPAVHAGSVLPATTEVWTPLYRCGHARCLKSSRGPNESVSGGLIGEVPPRELDVLHVPVRPQELGSDLTFDYLCSLCAH